MERPASRTFTVSRVERATTMLQEIDGVSALQDFLGTPVEACSLFGSGTTADPGRRLLSRVRSHPLLAALHGAFVDHRPVILSPDIIWLTLTQGLAQHVNANAQTLRQHFVKHEGQPQIVVQRDDFVKGSPTNLWPEAFGEFSRQIRNYIGAAHSLIVADFSTTGPIERAASEIVLMDAMQAFFSYEMVTMCGIPEITLEGTVDDWKSLATRVKEWTQYDLTWWLTPLEPILQEFIDAASGTVREKFWESIYKWQGPMGSGSPFVSGWIVNLFPYLNNPEASWQPGVAPMVRNAWLGQQGEEEGPARSEFPALPAKAPFVWDYIGTKFKMALLGGFVGVAQDRQTLALRPEIGWAVRDENAPTVSTRSGDEADYDPRDKMAVL